MTFPGGTSISRLTVYTGRCVDGLAGGTPHLHTASTEAYVVTGGTGALQTLDASGFREIPLEHGSLIWFTPGVIHRAVNHGDLRVLVVMSNAGLPEAGDAVMTFPPDVLATPESYAAAAVLPAKDDDAVARRRDLAVGEFLRLRDAAIRGDLAPLHAFYDAAARLVRGRIPQWREIWQATVAAQTARTAEMLNNLDAGDGSHLREGGVLGAPRSETDGWGMCGRLGTHDVRNPDTPGGSQ
ncbi:mannose-6-phosphate isomerase-like protein (cupin superfamily) [Catenuloplanes nepalensis]|uniref:Mannose-6-phosphate isomerase-like protein (Cupin superfamily) n=1 Tax=Catenuloplanes nepalensis TaxID=587533 RepID=A0ABT9MTU7_9ACTN|nr:cupin domain-containing protein [Catenuloplanes nepalensis]MDP9794849.1 mannose-6-phosphate isomerase-like protein (cupin superfamily) [Catenuloplanes nepalensis]